MSEQKRRGPMGGHGPGMRPTEKAMPEETRRE